MAYLVVMAAVLVASALLVLLPSKRRLALRLCLATFLSLPGVLAFQLVVGILLGILLAAVLGFEAVFHPPEWVRYVVGIPTILVMFVSLATASLVGCYTGARIGWQIGGGTPVRIAISEQEAVRYVLLWFRKDRT
jgi:hypothetical protein